MLLKFYFALYVLKSEKSFYKSNILIDFTKIKNYIGYMITIILIRKQKINLFGFVGIFRLLQISMDL